MEIPNILTGTETLSDLLLLSYSIERAIDDKEREVISTMKSCLEEAFGVRFEDISISKSKMADKRKIFSYNCFMAGVRISTICKTLGHHRASVRYYIYNYRELYKYDKDFRMMADKFKETTDRRIIQWNINGRQ